MSARSLADIPLRETDMAKTGAHSNIRCHVAAQYRDIMSLTAWARKDTKHKSSVVSPGKLHSCSAGAFPSRSNVRVDFVSESQQTIAEESVFHRAVSIISCEDHKLRGS